KDILKVGENRAEIGDPYPILRQTMDHLGDKIVAATPNRDLQPSARDRLDSRDRSKTLCRASVVCGEDDSSLRAVPLNQALRAVDVDDASVFDDCHSVAQPLGFLHEMCSQKNRLADSAAVRAICTPSPGRTRLTTPN